MKTNLVLGVVAAAGVLMSAGGALAQGARDDGYTVNLKKREGGGASTGGMVAMLMSQSDGDDTYTIRIENGEVTAEVNGKEVPKDRVVREDGHIKILDKDGKTLADFNDVKGDGKGAWWTGNANGQWWNGTNNQRELRLSPYTRVLRVGPQGQAQAQAQAWTPPKVMIGINMTEPSESLAEHLDLKPGTAILVDKVHEGLPGDKAGLKQGDVIVAIDGESPVTQEKIREVLNSKEAGDTVALVVLRKGGKETVKVKLEPYDAEKLGMQPMGGGPGGEDPGQLLEKYAAGVNDKEMQKRIQEAIKQLEEAARNGQLGGQGYVFGTPDQDGQFRFMTPGPGAGGEADRRMEELDHRLDELNSRLDEIHAKIDRLMEKFDQLRERGR